MAFVYLMQTNEANVHNFHAVDEGTTAYSIIIEASSQAYTFHPLLCLQLVNHAFPVLYYCFHGYGALFGVLSS